MEITGWRDDDGLDIATRLGERDKRERERDRKNTIASSFGER